MSRTTVYLAHKDRFDEIAVLHNSWGSAAFVWTVLANKYLGQDYQWCGGNSDDAVRKVWELVYDPRLFGDERIVLASTFDNALIEQSKFMVAAECFADFGARHWNGQVVCHTGEVSRLLLDHARLKTDCIGMCFWQTSVAEDPWLGRYDEAKDDYEPFDWDAGKHFFVFEHYGESLHECGPDCSKVNQR